MQIVIEIPDTNIPEDIIRVAKWEDGSLFDMVLRGAMRNATILPKGHGDLIDRQELLKLPIDKANYPSNYVKYVQTIIEKDRGKHEN